MITMVDHNDIDDNDISDIAGDDDDDADVYRDDT